MAKKNTQPLPEDARARAVNRETSYRYTAETEKRHELLFAPYDISFSAFRVLSYLLLHDGSAAPSEIADDLLILRQSMTNILDGLEKRALICRRTDSADRRRIRVELLPAGETLGVELLTLEDEFLVRMGSYVSDEERRSFHVLEKKMYDAKVAALGDILREREAEK